MIRQGRNQVRMWVNSINHLFHHDTVNLQFDRYMELEDKRERKRERAEDEQYFMSKCISMKVDDFHDSMLLNIIQYDRKNELKCNRLNYVLNSPNDTQVIG